MPNFFHVFCETFLAGLSLDHQQYGKLSSQDQKTNHSWLPFMGRGQTLNRQRIWTTHMSKPHLGCGIIEHLFGEVCIAIAFDVPVLWTNKTSISRAVIPISFVPTKFHLSIISKANMFHNCTKIFQAYTLFCLEHTSLISIWHLAFDIIFHNMPIT